jgi:hypothetical protein
MRDPISCCLSGVFEIEKRELDLKDVTKRIRNNIYPYISTRFDEQIKGGLGIDIYDYKFERRRGYSIIKEGNIEILLYRMESLSNIFSQAMEEFLGISDLKLLETNVTSKRTYGNAYKRMREDVRFDTSFLSEVYSSELVRYFYTEEEISKFRSYWTKEEVRTHPPLSKNKDTVAMSAEAGDRCQ